MSIKTNLLATAGVLPALLLATAAHAGAPPTESIIIQSNTPFLSVLQAGQSVIELTTNGDTPKSSIELGGVNTQYQINQYTTIAAGTSTMPTLAGALNFTDATVVIGQFLDIPGSKLIPGIGSSGYNGVDQNVLNKVSAFVEGHAGHDAHNIALDGVSQIAVNQLSVANVATSHADPSVLIAQVQAYPNDIYTSGILGGVFAQHIENSIKASNNGAGSVVIDGAHTVNGVSVSSDQFGINALNVAQVALGNGGDIALAQVAGYSRVANSGGYVAGGYSGEIDNTAFAWAADAVAPGAGMMFDPAVKNLTQIAITNANTLTVESGAAFTFHAADGVTGDTHFKSGGYAGQEFEFGPITGQTGGATSLDGYTTGIAMVNFALAANGHGSNGEEYGMSYGGNAGNFSFGNYEGGFGNSVLSNVAQQIALTINSVDIVGKLTAPTATTRHAAGAITVGKDNNTNDVIPFRQTAPGEIFIGPVFGSSGTRGAENIGYGFEQGFANLIADPNGATLAYNDPYMMREMLSANALGNAQFAVTGTGNAEVDGAKQLQAVSINSFTTSGDLIGASIAVGSPAGPDLLQYADVSQVMLSNVMGAGVTVKGNAAVSGNQALSYALNSVSVSGDASAHIDQTVAEGNSSALFNTAFAFSGGNNGDVTLGNPVGASAAATPLTQTVISSVNSVALGSATDAIVRQHIANPSVQFGSNSIVAASANNISAANISQTVLNAVNTISAIKL
jgi:hypothetical protein